jgi:signal transduction histidine kinase
MEEKRRNEFEKTLSICEETFHPIIHGIMQGSPIPQFVIDRRHEVVYWNKALEKYSGIKAREIIGTDQHWRAFYKTKRPCLADLLVDNKVGEIEKWYGGKYSKSGLIEGAYVATDFFPELGENGKWLYFTAATIKSNGGIIAAVETLEDITERKRAEEQLQEAKRQAEMYVELMGHDINNMNQVGIGYLEIALGEEGLGETVKRSMEKALGTLNDSSKLIKNVEKLKLISSGKVKVEKIDLGQILAGVRARYLGSPGRAVTINYTPMKGCSVWANELLTDVFANIVENAVKHSRGPVTIDIKIDKTMRDGKNYCMVTIDDNGPGIPDELKKRLFTRFQRGVTGAGGKGLGLYLVKSLVESFGGMVWAEDRVPGDPGKGSRFVVLLPSA